MHPFSVQLQHLNYVVPKFPEFFLKNIEKISLKMLIYSKFNIIENGFVSTFNQVNKVIRNLRGSPNFREFGMKSSVITEP